MTLVTPNERRGRIGVVPFNSLNLHPSLLQGIKELGFARPTPIQASAIPPALEGRDLLACAATGSGKTAAFVLPLLHRMIGKPRGRTKALILTPTRELAAQILEDLNQFALHTPITAAAIFGGVAMGPQEHALRSGVDVVVATPGRLLDHLKAPYTKFGQLDALVLDEADRMLDMGFLPDIRRILKHLPTKRQTLFFSATMPKPILELSKELLHDPVGIQLERKAAPAAGITQAVYPVPQELKPPLLAALLKRGDMSDALVFTRTKHRANRLAEFLTGQGIKTERIHGNRSQGQRMAALDGFKNGKFQVLVATDIAARGIDIEELGHVVNFDVPKASEDYIHRVGRTARAEATGEAFTFVSPQEEADLRSIEQAIGKRLPRVTVPDFDYNARTQQRFEIPIGERIRAIRAEKAKQRQRAKENAARRAAHLRQGGSGSSSSSRPAAPGGPPRSSGQGGGAASGRSPGAPSSRPGGQGSRPGGGPARHGNGPSRPGGRPSRPAGPGQRSDGARGPRRRGRP
jgi:ATP-dependent RNA helicase RhlE